MMRRSRSEKWAERYDRVIAVIAKCISIMLGLLLWNTFVAPWWDLPRLTPWQAVVLSLIGCFWWN